MTEEITTSLLTRVLEWLPEHLRDNANGSGTLLNIILNEVSSDRDVRITGGASAARAEAALIAVLQKLLSRPAGKRFQTLVVCPSRESEEIMEELAADIASSISVSVRGTSGLRNKTSLLKAFETPADVVIASLHTVEKLLEIGVLELEQIRTVIIDDIEWFEAQGDLKKLQSFTESLPAARQLIGITNQGDIDDRIIDLLHAPVICRAPNLSENSRTIAQRLIVVNDDAWSDTIAELSDGMPTLYISDSPTLSTRLIALLKAQGNDAKRATVTQTDSARKTLLLKFTAGLVSHLVCPTSLLKGFDKAALRRIVHTDVPGGARPYLNHADYLAEGGELITVISPEDIQLVESLLVSAQRKLTVENPTGIEDLPEEVGQIVSRQKLTIRTDFGKTVETENTEDDSPYVENEEPDGDDHREKRYFKRKNPRFNKNRKFNKKDKHNFKPRREADIDEYQPKEEIVSSDSDSQEQPQGDKKPWKKRRSPYQKRRFDKRPYRERQDNEQEGNAIAAPEATVLVESAPYENAPRQESAEHTETEGDRPFERTRRTKTKYNRFKKPYRKDRRPQNNEGENIQPQVSEAPSTVTESSSDSAENYSQPKKFNKYPQKKRPYQQKTKKQYKQPREDAWDDDNFGNSIHYQPRRQNLRTLRSDEPLHWEPSDPYHPSSQALSLPQMMPDENGFRPHRQKNDRKTNFNRMKKPGFKKYRGSGEN